MEKIKRLSKCASEYDYLLALSSGTTLVFLLEYAAQIYGRPFYIWSEVLCSVVTVLPKNSNTTCTLGLIIKNPFQKYDR